MRITPVLLAVLLLAGCSDPGRPYDPEVGANEAAVRVVVQDNHRERVANATILVQPGNAVGTTDHLGIFVANGLPPGNATVKAYAPGYSDAREDVVLKAGETQEVILIVDRMR